MRPMPDAMNVSGRGCIDAGAGARSSSVVPRARGDSLLGDEILRSDRCARRAGSRAARYRRSAGQYIRAPIAGGNGSATRGTFVPARIAIDEAVRARSAGNRGRFRRNQRRPALGTAAVALIARPFGQLSDRAAAGRIALEMPRTTTRLVGARRRRGRGGDASSPAPLPMPRPCSTTTPRPGPAAPRRGPPGRTGPTTSTRQPARRALPVYARRAGRSPAAPRPRALLEPRRLGRWPPSCATASRGPAATRCSSTTSGPAFRGAPGRRPRRGLRAPPRQTAPYAPDGRWPAACTSTSSPAAGAC